MVIQPIVTTFTGGAANDAQKDYTNKANDALTAAAGKVQGYQQPYMDTGQQGLTGITNNLSYLTSPISMNQKQLQDTPGYQFSLQQGLQGVNNQQSAMGLANSGAAIKAGANFAQGLASNTYQQQYGNALSSQSQLFNNLMGLSGLGETASQATGNAQMNAATNISSNYTGLGNATAAYYNSIGGSVNNSLNNAWGAVGAHYFQQ